MRQASDPDFAPPVEEGVVFAFQDENGELSSFEFLGLILHNDRRYGFFLPVEGEEDASGTGASGSGPASNEVVILEVTALDDEGQPETFELLVDEAIAAEVYEKFKHATAGMYDFA